MRNLIIILGISGLLSLAPATADDSAPFNYQFQLSFERSSLDGLTLGDDLSEDRQIEEDYEFEFALDYWVTDEVYLFFTGALINETETIETIDREEKVNGFERKEIGVGFFFGEVVPSELKLGRVELVSASEWWLWWDEELDSISLQSNYRDFEATLALAEEQAREKTDDDFIDPEQDRVKRILFSLAWEFAPSHSLIAYYLDQSDDSRSFAVGEFENFDEIDEEDSDLTWTGISYLGDFEVDSIGEFAVEWHLSRVSGDETIYEFDDPDAGMAEVAEREEKSVSGSAQSYLLSWTPAAFDDWTFLLGRARGSGDANPDNRRDRSFRQTGLQGDSEAFGELYEPELSNLEVNVIGLEWEVSEGVEIGLLKYDYEQRKLADEMRDVGIELDLTGSSRDLGQEMDLVVTIQAREGLEIVVTVAEFDPGRAYGARKGETSDYLNLELSYEF